MIILKIFRHSVLLLSSVSSICLVSTVHAQVARSTSSALKSGTTEAGTSQPTSQASDPAANPGEIVVTARRQNERLQDVPVAVTAFGSAALASRSIDTLDQIARYTPNIRFDNAAQLSGGNYNATVFIRGVGSNDFAIFSDPGVGFYVDDVYYARSIGNVLDAVDLDSVQVLRGPQGTLFGKNTIGGAVLIATGKPELGRTSGRIEATTGRYNRIDVKGAINLPIGDNAALRISAATLNRDGYVKRLLDGGDMGNRNSDSVRAKFRYQPNDALTIDLSGDYTRAREHSAPSDLLAVGNAPGITGIPYLVNYNIYVAPTRGVVAPNGLRTLNPSFITASPFETWAGGPNINNLDLWGGQGIISYNFGGATVKSITAYRDMHAVFYRDGDNTPFVYRETSNDDRQWQFSQELQLTGKAIGDRLSYVFGLYYFKEKASDIARADLAIGLYSPPFPPPSSPAALPNNFTDNRSLAGYAQLGFAITPTLNIELGGRYSDDKKDFRTSIIRQSDGVAYIEATRSGTFKKFTPKIGVNFKPAQDFLLYGSYSQGFKQGGFNGRPLVSASEVTRYSPEALDTFELGIKSQLLDRKLTANLAVFHSIYKDIQLTVNQTPQNFVANAAKGKISGFEAELVARPAPWLTFNGSIGYLLARYSEIGQGLAATQVLPITVNSRFVKAPKLTTSFGAEIAHHFDNGSGLTLRSDVSTYSKVYHDVGNSPLVTDDGYTLVNARLAYTLAGNALALSVFGTNLTNSLYIASGNVSSGFGLAEVAYGRPREWGISAAYKF